MLAHEVLIKHMLRSRFGVRGDLPGIDRHFGHLFQHHGVVDRLSRILAPRKGAVVAANGSGHMNRVQFPLPEGLHDHQTGIALVVFFYLLLRQTPAAGTGP